MTALGIGAFKLKLNHRRLLDAMLDIAGVPPQKFRCASPFMLSPQTQPYVPSARAILPYARLEC